MAIQQRRGLYKDFDKSKMLPAEYAVTLGKDATADDTNYERVYATFSNGSVKRMMTVEDAANQLTEATETATKQADADATLAKSYAVGGTGARTGEDTDNAKYYSEQAATSATNAKTSETNAASSASTASTKASAASTSATNAASSASAAAQSAIDAANKVASLGTAGSTTQPVYFSSGKPVATSYSVAKSVPSDAVFTDTHYASGSVVNNSATAVSNTTTALANGNVYLNHVENGAVKNSHKISGSGATTVASDASGNIVISSTDTNTTYGVATTSANGLMSSTDKSKLDGVASGANKYTLPVATSTTLGGVMPVAKTTAMTTPVGVDASGKLFVEAAQGQTDLSDKTVGTFTASTASYPTLTAGDTLKVICGKIVKWFADAASGFVKIADLATSLVNDGTKAVAASLLYSLIGTDTLTTTSQTVKGAINELNSNSSVATIDLTQYTLSSGTWFTGYPNKAYIYPNHTVLLEFGITECTSGVLFTLPSSIKPIKNIVGLASTNNTCLASLNIRSSGEFVKNYAYGNTDVGLFGTYFYSLR